MCRAKIIISPDVFVAFNLFSLGYLSAVACDNERLYENVSLCLFHFNATANDYLGQKYPLSALFDVKTHFFSTSRLSSTRLWFNLETLHKFPSAMSPHEDEKVRER